MGIKTAVTHVDHFTLEHCAEEHQDGILVGNKNISSLPF